ncbi:MAG: 3-dehydroquinate synthase II [Candidatus Hermodarchaeota archaeon]
MKKIILDFETKGPNFNELVQEAFNRNFLDYLITKQTLNEFKGIEWINLYSKNPNILTQYLIYEDKNLLINNLTSKKDSIKNIGFFIELETKEDEQEIVQLAEKGYVDFVIVSAKNWKIIPFENLIAGMHLYDTELIALVENTKDAEILLKTLEIGVDGIMIKPTNVNEIIELKKLIHSNYHLELTDATVKKIQNIPESERVCVDTTSLLNIGEGFLVGSTAKGFCLIHSETLKNQFVSPRPFRVNAGDVSAYILVPDDDPSKVYRTKYLSEIKGGDRVLAVNSEGDARIVFVGRIKIETRPMLRFELETLDKDKKIQLSCICQNAETVRLIGADGKVRSVVNIKIGDKILVHLGSGATHFGTFIKETIIEK